MLFNYTLLCSIYLMKRIFKFFESKIKMLRQKFCYREYTKNNVKVYNYSFFFFF